MPIARHKIHDSFLKNMIKACSFSFIFYLLCRLSTQIFFYKAASFSEVFYSLYLGIKFDLRLIAIQFLPFLILYSLTRFKNKILNFIFALIAALAQIFIVIIYIMDFGHFSYLTHRVSSGIFLDDMVETETALTMAKDTYPIPLALLGIALLIFLYYKYLTKSMCSLEKIKPKKNEQILCYFLFFLFLFGNIGLKPLRSTDAYFSHNRYLAQTSRNPVFSVFGTWDEEKNIFPDFKRKDLESTLNSFFQEAPENRTIKTEQKEKQNVLIVLLESLTAHQSGVFNNPLNATPELDKLAEESLLFTNFFTPGYKTNRGIWTMLTGLPDVRSTVPRSRDVKNLKQNTYFQNFTDYEKLYFIGGHANWGNLDKFYETSIPDLKLFQQEHTGKKPVDAWGISDKEFFEFALEKLNSLDKPFVSILQSSGFHRPYTIPDHVGFKAEENIPSDQLKKYGFHSLAEYNSLKLQDFSFGHFMKKFKQSKHYKNTVLIVVGDHGLNTHQSDNLAKGYTYHRLSMHHSPLLIHVPKLGMTGINSEVLASQIDIFPTAASLAGVSVKTSALGRNLFEPRGENQNYAFIFSWDYRPSLVGVINKEYYLEILNNKAQVFDYKSDKPFLDHSENIPLKTKYMNNLAKSIYQYSLFKATGL